MNLQRVVICTSLLAAIVGANAAPAPVARPLHIVAKAADGIAVVTIGSAVADFKTSNTQYAIEVNEAHRGSLTQKCLDGPLGLKVGRKYVVFLDSIATEHGCGSSRIAGAIEPTAFEVDTLDGNGDFVRLDNRRVIAPRFDDRIEVKQVLEMDGERSETVLGTMVPLRTFISYVLR
jgi:hypothetical protein